MPSLAIWRGSSVSGRRNRSLLSRAGTRAAAGRTVRCPRLHQLPSVPWGGRHLPLPGPPIVRNLRRFSVAGLSDLSYRAHAAP